MEILSLSAEKNKLFFDFQPKSVVWMNHERGSRSPEALDCKSCLVYLEPLISYPRIYVRRYPVLVISHWTAQGNSAWFQQVRRHHERDHNMALVPLHTITMAFAACSGVTSGTSFPILGTRSRLPGLCLPVV